MAPKSAGAIYDDATFDQWSTPVENLIFNKNAYVFGNTGDSTFKLYGNDDTLLNELVVIEDNIIEGVSAQRNPDLVGISSVLHTSVASDVNESPALCPNLSRYEDHCE